MTINDRGQAEVTVKFVNLSSAGIAFLRGFYKICNCRVIALTIFYCLLVSVVSSCTTKASDGCVRKYYLGYTVVTFPHLAGNCKAMDAKEVTNIGLSLGLPSGIAVGYNKDTAFDLSPDGRVIFVVQTDKQFEEAKRLILQLNSIGTCAIQSPNPLK